MNLYLLGLLVYMVLILPLRVSIRFRAGRRTGYLIRIQAAGLPFYRKRKDEDPKDEMPVTEKQMVCDLKHTNLRALRILLSRPVRQRLAAAVQLEWLSLYAHISQPDAAQTALLYGGLRALALPLVRQRHIPLRIHLKADMKGQGSEALFRCILRLRLGSLFPAALQWLRQSMKASKEENHAASH